MVAEEEEEVMVVVKVTKGGTQGRGGLRLRKVESVRNKGRLADLAVQWSKLELIVAYLIRHCSLRQKIHLLSRGTLPVLLQVPRCLPGLRQAYRASHTYILPR